MNYEGGAESETMAAARDRKKTLSLITDGNYPAVIRRVISSFIFPSYLLLLFLQQTASDSELVKDPLQDVPFGNAKVQGTPEPVRGSMDFNKFL